MMLQSTAAVIETIAALRSALAEARSDGRTIALVPTMGALHAGHLSLIEQAREAADVVVVSIFVNPTQFNDPGDLAAYPRDLERDVRLATDAGADLIFAPAAEELYPEGFCTEVRVTGPLTETLEGAHRGSAHFHGVTTVVTKLLTITAPDIAVLGDKDAQQVRVIERLVRDLHLPVQIHRAPTVRDPDGLAQSSRNARLSAAAREQALGISRALTAAATSSRPVDAARTVLADHAIEPEYIALCDPDTLAPTSGPHGLLLIAAEVGGVRLIDNTTINPEP